MSPEEELKATAELFREEKRDWFGEKDGNFKRFTDSLNEGTADPLLSSRMLRALSKYENRAFEHLMYNTGWLWGRDQDVPAKVEILEMPEMVEAANFYGARDTYEAQEVLEDALRADAETVRSKERVRAFARNIMDPKVIETFKKLRKSYDKVRPHPSIVVELARGLSTAGSTDTDLLKRSCDVVTSYYNDPAYQIVDHLSRAGEGRAGALVDYMGSDAVKTSVGVVENALVDFYGEKRITAEVMEDITNYVDYVAGLVADGKTGYADDLVGGIMNLHERGMKAMLTSVAGNIEWFKSVVGEKADGVIRYVVKRGGADDMAIMDSVLHGDHYVTVSEYIKKIEMPDEFGFKQAKRLMRLVEYLNCLCSMGVRPQLPAPENGDSALMRAFGYAEYMVKERMTELGVKDIEKGMRFVPWVATKDPTAMKVLSGGGVRKNGISRVYPIGSGNQDANRRMVEELLSYAGMMGYDMKIESYDTASMKSAARKMMSELERRADSLDQKVVGELKPNLSRIINTAHASGEKYFLHLEPRNMESQMYALQSVTSCLSPGSMMYDSTREMMRNSNVFWGVIKDGSGRTYGRVTILRGKQDGEGVVARASMVYSMVPVDETSVDNVLSQYAKESGMKVARPGKIVVPGLKGDAYDDFISGEGPNITLSDPRTSRPNWSTVA